MASFNVQFLFLFTFILRANCQYEPFENTREIFASRPATEDSQFLANLYRLIGKELKWTSHSDLARLSRQALQQSADDVSNSCVAAVETTINGLLKGEKWALKMVDAAGKLPSSLLRDFRTIWLGSYTECVEIAAIVPNAQDNTTNIGINGRYCLANIPFGKLMGGAVSSIGSAVCVPSNCNETEAKTLVRAVVNMTSSTVGALVPKLAVNSSDVQVTCQPTEKVVDTRAIVAFVVVAFFVVFIIVGTSYDVYDQFFRSTVDEGDELGLVVNESKASQKGFLCNFILSFSVYNNGKKILSAKQTAGSLECINGIRFLSMTWVILGHTLVIGNSPGAIGNMGDLPIYAKRWTFLAIVNATVSVDTFFVLSGLLVTYLTLKEMDRRKGKLNWLMFYVHRYIRLTPPYLLVMMIYVCLIQYTGSGPYWQVDTDLNCRYNWWTNVLYINNIVHSDKQCMGWAWYLANDMQFYVISPVILIPLFRSSFIGLGVWAVFLVGTIVTPGVISSVNYIGLYGNVKDAPPGTHQTPVWSTLYVRPYTRMSTYLVGMLVGYVLYRTKCKARLPKVAVLFGWLAAAFLCISTLYGVYDPLNGKPWTNNVTSLFNATFRFGWSLGVGWVIFACCSGYGGFVNMLLSWSALIPLSRLTYCAYLVHPVLIMWYKHQQEVPTLYTIPNIIYYFFGNLVFAYSSAFVASLMFESTTMGVEKTVLGQFR